MPVWATAAAPPMMNRRFLGLMVPSTRAAPAALGGVKLSRAPIHLGMGTSSPSWGRARHWRTATRTSRRPRTSLSQSTQAAGSPSWLALDGPAMASRTAPARAIPTIQPARNAGPLLRARGVTSISTTATIGSGLMATPTANGSSCPIASPMSPALRPAPTVGSHPAPGRGGPSSPQAGDFLTDTTTPRWVAGRAPPSAHRLLHQRADPLLVGGGQLRQREGGRPHGAVVEVRVAIEAERRVPLLELRRGCEEADDLALLGVRRHPVPGLRGEVRRALLDDGVEPLGHGAIGFRQLGDLLEHGLLSGRLVLLRARLRPQLFGALLHRAPFLVAEPLARLAGGGLGGLLGGGHRRLPPCRSRWDGPHAKGAAVAPASPNLTDRRLGATGDDQGPRAVRTAGTTSLARRSTCAAGSGPTGWRLKALKPRPASPASCSATASAGPATTDGLAPGRSCSSTRTPRL